MTRTIAGVVAAAMLLPVSVIGQSEWSQSGTVERAFAAGGLVNLDLSAGDYLVQAGPANLLRVTWHTRTEEQARDVKVRAAVDAKEATVTTDGPNKSFRVEIEVPARSDLLLRMTAGNLRVIGIEGHKDVRLRAGDLDIEVGDPKAYRHVHASVTAGDLKATPFGYETGGLFRSFSHEGRGSFDLRARLWAGDLRLVGASPRED